MDELGRQFEEVQSRLEASRQTCNGIIDKYERDMLNQVQQAFLEIKMFMEQGVEIPVNDLTGVISNELYALQIRAQQFKRLTVIMRGFSISSEMVLSNEITPGPSRRPVFNINKEQEDEEETQATGNIISFEKPIITTIPTNTADTDAKIIPASPQEIIAVVETDKSAVQVVDSSTLPPPRASKKARTAESAAFKRQL